MIEVGDLITLSHRGRQLMFGSDDLCVPLGLVVGLNNPYNRKNIHLYDKLVEIVWLHSKYALPKEMERFCLKLVQKVGSK